VTGLFPIRHPARIAYAAEGRYYPVTTAKFLAMSIATGGLYPLFWLWKCWRWARRIQGEEIAPFWRAFFGALWLPRLFARANGALESGQAPPWLGLASTTACVAWTFGWSILARRLGLSPAIGLIGYASFVFYLPTVIAVRRLNDTAPQVVAANSRYTQLSWLGIAGSAAFWLVEVLGTMASG